MRGIKQCTKVLTHIMRLYVVGALSLTGLLGQKNGSRELTTCSSRRSAHASLPRVFPLRVQIKSQKSTL